RNLAAIRHSGARMSEIKLGSLEPAHIQQLIADALRSTPEYVAPLAELVQAKTAGNPFFVLQFLQALADEGLLAFDHEAQRWSWDLDRIHAKGYADNVVDLMVASSPAWRKTPGRHCSSSPVLAASETSGRLGSCSGLRGLTFTGLFGTPSDSRWSSACR